MKKCLLIFVLSIIISTSFAQITWMGNEYTTLGGTQYLGDDILFEIQSYPVASGQGAQVYIDWQDDGYGSTQNIDWFALDWIRQSGNNSVWNKYVKMREVGTHNRRYLGWQTGQTDYVTGNIGEFTVSALNNPTVGTLTAYDNSVDLNWTKDAQSHNVMIVRIISSQSFTEPTQGSAYSVTDKIGDGVVVYNGSGTSTTDGGLDINTSYTYKFYSENNSYYSSGEAASPVSTLPVELTSFTALVSGKSINLNWKTATEVNNFGFSIERRTNSEEWINLGFVNGAGNSNSPKEYTYVDETVTSGNYIYRLKQIDNDGQFKYSNEIEIAVNNIAESFKLEQNFPNPFNPTTSIKFGFNEDTEVNLVVFDQIGNQVASLFKGKADAGRIYNAEFNAAGLASGIYFYKLETPRRSEIRKMLLMK